MFSRLAFVCIACVTLASAANGADTPDPADPPTLSYATQGDLVISENKVMAEIATLNKKLDALIAAAGQTPAPIAELEKRLKAVEEAQEKMIRLGNNQGLAIDQITARDEQGNYYPVINGNMQQAREALATAMQKTIPDFGVFVVHNRVAADRWITINGDQYRIPALGERSFKFSPGTISTKVTGEHEKNWYLGPVNNYKHEIDINDRPAVRYVYQSSPVYIDGGEWIAAY